MPAPANVLTCAKLQVAGYDPDFVQKGTLPHAAVTALGRVITHVVHGIDRQVGEVPFGFFTLFSEDPICTIRGTQTPDGTDVEWLDDFEAVLEPCPFMPGRWHKGFGDEYTTFTATRVDPDGVPMAGTTVPLWQVLQALPNVQVHGHSKGAPQAAYAASQARTVLPPVLFACPKWGDSVLRSQANGFWPCTYGPAILSFENPNDVVPKVPLTVDWPFQIEDFQPIATPQILLPDSVLPPIGSSWKESHSMDSYLRLLQAIP